MTAKQQTQLNILAYAGIVLMMGGIVLPVVFPQMPIWSGILLGVLLGTPLLIGGMMQDSKKSHVVDAALATDKGESSPAPQGFWPSRRELWNLLAALTFFGVMLLPYAAFIPLFLLLPAGDTWPLVVARVTLLALTIGGIFGWFDFARKTFPKYFRGKVSNETLDEFLKSAPVVQPKNVREAVFKNWHWVATATLSFLIAWGIVDFNHPMLNIEGNGRRVRGKVKVLAWCRGNPNTVRSCAGLVGIAALAVYGNEIRKAKQRSTARSTEVASEHVVQQISGEVN